MSNSIKKASFEEKGVLLMNRIIKKIPLIRFIDTTSLTNFYSKSFVVISTILLVASFLFVAVHLILAVVNLGYAIYISCILIIAIIALLIMIEESSSTKSAISKEEKNEGTET